MARFGFVGPSYQSEAVNADCQRCRNWYVESMESGDAASAATLYPTPGLTPFVQLPGSGPLRGLHEYNGRVFAVTDKVYEVKSDKTYTDLAFGGPPNDGKPVTMATNSAGHLLVCGAGQMWMHPINPVPVYTLQLLGMENDSAVLGSVAAVFQNGLILYFNNNTSPNASQAKEGDQVYFNGITDPSLSTLNGLSAQITGLSPAWGILNFPDDPTYLFWGLVVTTLPRDWVPPTTLPASNPLAFSGNATNQIPQGNVGAGLGPIEMVAFCDDYFLALVQNSATFYSSGPNDGSTWDASFSYTVNEFPEDVIAMAVLRREIWLFSNKHILPYYDAGDALLPFQPNPAAFIETGLAAEWSIGKLAGTLFWLGRDDRGKGIAYAAQGYTPQRISTHALENEWAQYSTIADAIGYTVQINGHPFWHLEFPAAGKSWRYDAMTNLWHEVTTTKSDNSQGLHRSRWQIEAFGIHLVGDNQSSWLYQLDKAAVADNITNSGARPIVRTRRAPHINSELEWEFHHRLRVHMETGLGPTPPLVGTAIGVPFIIVADPSGIQWQVTIQDNGNAHATSLGPGTPTQVYMFQDIASITPAWYQLGIGVGGSPITLTPVNGAGGGWLKRLPMMTQPGGLQTSISVQNGVFYADPPITPPREPQVMLRWSDDGGHTWSNEYAIGAGSAGEFTKRVEWRRLGRSRDRVYEISVSDPIPWRIIDAYLFTTPSNQQPMQRYAAQMAKMA